ncbi:MAG: hypothetical protein JWN56_681 [Sphingobacteriales bacterium]|nr:hypothetical protein [Sphingobacteriales bacterium]
MYTKATFILILTLLLVSVKISAQTRDTLIKIGNDTAKNSPKVKPKVGPIKDAARLELEAKPRRGALQSAILPGLGNYKNKSFAWYLKVPAIYAGLIIFTDQFIYNKNKYKFILQQAKYKQENTEASIAAMDPRYRNIELSVLTDAKDLFRRNRDLCVLGGLAVYGINIIDAYVAGKFLRYDITPELSLRVNPSLQGQYQVSSGSALPAPALKISLSFK